MLRRSHPCADDRARTAKRSAAPGEILSALSAPADVRVLQSSVVLGLPLQVRVHDQGPLAVAGAFSVD
jgi:hypothetical protein